MDAPDTAQTESITRVHHESLYTEEEKKEIAKIVFPEKPFDQIDFNNVWMLADLYPNDLDFNCFTFGCRLSL